MVSRQIGMTAPAAGDWMHGRVKPAAAVAKLRTAEGSPDCGGPPRRWGFTGTPLQIKGNWHVSLARAREMSDAADADARNIKACSPTFSAAYPCHFSGR